MTPVEGSVDLKGVVTYRLRTIDLEEKYKVLLERRERKAVDALCPMLSKKKIDRGANMTMLWSYIP